MPLYPTSSEIGSSSDPQAEFLSLRAVAWSGWSVLDVVRRGVEANIGGDWLICHTLAVLINYFELFEKSIMMRLTH